MTESSTLDVDETKPSFKRGSFWGLLVSMAGLLLAPLGLLLSIRASADRLPVFLYHAELLLLPLGLLFAIGGVVGGFRAHRAAKASGRRASGALASVITGCIGVASSLFLILGCVLVWNEYSVWKDCSWWAHNAGKTPSVTQTECDDEFRGSLSERLDIPPQSVPPLSNL